MKRNFSMTEFLKRKYREVERAMSFSATDAKEAKAWQRRFYRKVVDLLGGFPPPCELNARIVSSEKDDGYTRHKLYFDSEPGMSVAAWVLVPDGIERGERRAGVLALHGHGNGKDDVVGIDGGDPKRRKNIKAHNYDYARQFAKRGYVVIAPDHRRWGERECGIAEAVKPRDPCNIIYIESMLFGLNPLMMNVWDAMRCYDYLTTRHDVDRERIGAVGLSYGGTVSLYVAALDPRIKAVIVSCYLTTYESYGLGLHNFCGSQIATGLLSYGEISDVAALITPRPALYEMGIKDEGFPIEASRKAYAQVRRAYKVMGALDSLELDEFDGGHQFSGSKAFDFFAKWLAHDMIGGNLWNQ
jgi:fermentation-respiration switch protein FrsA (DUF1100 family)